MIAMRFDMFHSLADFFVDDRALRKPRPYLPDPIELARMCGMQLEGDGTAPLTEKKGAPAGAKR